MAPAIRAAATANVTRIPAATAPGGAVMRPAVPVARANTAPMKEAPVTSPRLRARLSMPALTPRWSGLTSAMTAVLLATWNSA